jgi:hypothetical protein
MGDMVEVWTTPAGVQKIIDKFVAHCESLKAQITEGQGREKSLQDLVQLSGDALKWLMNLTYGVGKAGDERGPEPGEMEAALAEGAKALDAIARWSIKTKAVL